LLLALGIAVVIAVIVAIVFALSQNRQNEIARLTAIADLKSGQIEIWFRERYGDAKYVGTSPYIQELAASWRERKDRGARDRLLDRLEQTRSAYGYEGAYFFDGAEQTLQGRQDQIDIGPQLQSVIQDAIKSNSVKYIGPYFENGRIALDFVSPLAGKAQGLGAAIVLRTDPKQLLFPLLDSWPYPSSTGESVLLRRDGNQVAFLSDLRFQPNAAGRYRIPLKDRGVLSVQALGSGARLGALIEGVDYRHVPSIGIVRPIRGSDWFLLTKVALGEITSAGYRSAMWILLLGLLSLLFIIGVAVALRQRQLLLDNLLEQAIKDERIRSLEILDAISVSSSDAIFAKDLQGRYLMCNAEAARMLGGDAKDVLGRDDMTIFPHDVAAQFVANDQSVIALGRSETFVETFGDGPEKIILQTTKGPLRDCSGAVIGIFGFARDVTAQQRSELRLRESEERFRKIFEDTRQPTMLVEDGRFIAANAAALTLLGVERPAQFIGKTPEDISPPYQPDGRPSGEKALEHIATAFAQGSNEFEWEHIRANGEHFIARVLLTPIREGGKDLLHAVWNDITAQKEAEKKLVEYQKDLERRVADRTAELTAMTDTLRQANDERQAVFDAATVGVILTRGGRIIRCNRTMELLFGYEPDELTGKSTRVLCPDDRSHEEITSQLLSSLKSSGSYRDERQLIRKDGTLFWCREMAQAIDRNNLDSGFASTFEDIGIERAALEEMQRAKALAEEVAAAKANFLANMSHEIRTPMNAVIGMTHLALRSNQDPRVQDFLQKIKSSSEHLLGVINDILDFSKIEAGKMTIETVDFDLESTLDNAFALVAEKSASKNLEVIINVAANVPRRLLGDPLRIQQILVNYLNNAVKFTETGEIVLGVVATRLTDDEVTLRFYVRDSGIGISKDQHGRLFQSFHQVDPSTTRRFGGTGLGLAIVKRLAEAMGGEVGLDSAPNEGSTFWFTATFGLSKKPMNRAAPQPRLRGRRVLVVDDHPEAREVLESMLRSLGFETTALATGAEALAELKQAGESGAHYEIVFLDWKMPGMNGVAVAGEIERLALERPPVVLMVTAFDRNELLRVAADVRIDDVLCKPFTTSTLLDTISRVLSGTSATTPLVPISDADLPTAAVKLRGVKILLVEDNELNQEVATGLLETFGVSVDVAANGAKAIEMAEAGDYDIILMDIQMPVMDGVAATRALRARPRFRDIPILAMTASVLRDDQERFLAAGMNDHIAKPVDPSELVTALLIWAPGASSKAVAPEPEREIESAAKPRILPETIDGLDVAAGLRRVLGNETLYVSLLRKFIAGQKDAPARLGEMINAGNLEDAERLAHTMKGVAGTIGATRLQSAAADLEQSLHERQAWEALSPRLEAHGKAVRDLLSSLELSLPPDSPNVAQVDAATLDALCERLHLLLAESDAQALDLLMENSELLRAAFPTQFRALKKTVEAFDYEAALEVLGDARAKRKTADPAPAAP
jgi:two-component system, sensor histidine kinase and response regulator